ncbi:MAG: S41 family peptidase [candidate division Zixibacteria bacterium]|nr:S41 family peptidase [candidate division Zixibacteria bacterium]
MNSRSCSQHREVTRIVIATLILTALLVFVAKTIQAQSPADIPQIDAAMRAAIIDSVTAKFNTIYVFPDVAKDMEKYVRKRMQDKAYDTLTDQAQFCEVLTNDLLEVCHDKHLWVRYASDEVLKFANTDSLTDDQRKELLRRQAYDNYGFYKLERLTGNVGYLDLRAFTDASIAGETAIAAMKFLGNCNALIFDLRQNGGGSPSMIQLISSYFFNDKQHLNSFYVRQTDSIVQFWTQEYVDGNKMVDVPIFILTSDYTFSGAEEFTYNLKNMKRATVVGETTGGGAHPVERHAFDNLHVVMSVPFGRAINPITGTNWEGTGIAPHIETPAEQALDVAHIEALKAILQNTTEENLIAGLTWTIANLEALHAPAVIDHAVMQKYAGVYGPRTIRYENGELVYQREGRLPYPMVAMSEDTFVFKDIPYFRLKVEMDGDGNPVALIGLYDDGHTDRSPIGAEEKK